MKTLKEWKAWLRFTVGIVLVIYVLPLVVMALKGH